MRPPLWAGVALILFSINSSTAVDPAGSITEVDAVRLFLDESPQAPLISLRAEATGAAANIGTEVANPSVTYQIEDAAGVRDEFLTFQQELPITGRRSLLHDRAAAASAVAGFLGRRDLQDATRSLRVAFYDVLYRVGVIEILGRGEQELGETVEMLRQREREGEGSGYDVLRAEQETAELQVELGRAGAALASARAMFGSFFAEPLAMDLAVLEGDFTLAESPWMVDEAVPVALAERADLMALQQEARQQEIDLQAARRQRFPEPILSAGWKRVEVLGRSDTGFVGSLMVPLPVFQHGKYAAVRARAAASQVDLQKEILARKIRAEVQSALARAQAARQAAGRFGGDVERRAGDLRHIAQLAFDEGESGILELLDAVRTSLRMELQALAARHEARREQINLDHVMGREVRP
jgi:cobalt-zinc-cadmium efflux system outer membrane protein